MAVQIGAKPDSGLDDPIGVLRDCHRRIERFLGVLCVIADRARDPAVTRHALTNDTLAGYVLNAQERDSIQAALHYFSESGPRHNQDEEQSVFPRLRKAGKESILSELDRLEEDHHRADVLHQKAALLYSEWLASGLTEEQLGLLSDATQQLRDIYASHIRIEEEIVFPQAERAFDAIDLRQVGAEFKARRGLA